MADNRKPRLVSITIISVVVASLSLLFVFMLASEVNGLKTELTQIENFTESQNTFNSDVISWSRAVNTAITDLYNGTG